MQAVPTDPRRRELFAAFQEALRQVAAEKAAKAEAAVVELLVKLNVGPESDWAEVAPLLAAAPAAQAVPEGRRAELFDVRVREVGSGCLCCLLVLFRVCIWWAYSMGLRQCYNGREVVEQVFACTPVLQASCAA
jgi:hypothetical protein